jgi:hypothetical protein
MCVGGGCCGGDGGGGGGRSLHPLAPHPRSPPMGQTTPPTPSHQQSPKKGGAHLLHTPRRRCPLRRPRADPQGAGGWGGVATQGEWEGVREPPGTNVEAVLPRPQRPPLRLPTPTTPAPISIQMSPCKPKFPVVRIQIAELSELWKSKEGH